LKIVFQIVVLFFSLNSFSQTIDGDAPIKNEPEIFTIVETPAEFPGGTQEMIKFLGKNMIYPEKAKRLLIGGKVFLKFVVFEDGSIHNTEVIKGSGLDDLDDEAVRVVRMMPTWKAAEMTGKKVKCYFNLPVNFNMGEPFYLYNTANKDPDYNRIIRLIFEEKPDEAKLAIERIEPINDLDLIYASAVLKYHSKNRKEACRMFEKIIRNGTNNTSIYNNSIKYLKEYCNG
jgi:TonB family protein